MTEWFEQWFGEEYHAIYPHRDAADAQRVVALVRRVAAWQEGDAVLDLACGAGRHAAALEEAGAHVVGLDLSAAMLYRARTRGGARLVRGDMRALPFRAGVFQLAVNLFTSFGYFRDDEEHQLVVREVVRVLTSGGRFVLDYLNAGRVRDELARGDGRSDEGGVRIRRWISEDGRYVVKEIELRDAGRSFQERVRLFTATELRALFAVAGLEVSATFGEYDGAPATADASRIILVGVRP